MGVIRPSPGDGMARAHPQGGEAGRSGEPWRRVRTLAAARKPRSSLWAASPLVGRPLVFLGQLLPFGEDPSPWLGDPPSRLGDPSSCLGSLRPFWETPRLFGAASALFGRSSVFLGSPSPRASE